MRLSSKGRRRLFASRVQPIFAYDTLEPRRLMTGETVQTVIPPVLANVTTPSNNSITLNQHFFDATLPGSLATFNTSYGSVQVALTDPETPQTVANFLSYVNSGEYNNTFFHRSVDLISGNAASPSDHATIVQGGGYTLTNGSIGHITTSAPVNDEYSSELYGNVAGTLAMAKTSQANSATSEWYFNVTDNTQLDTPTVDSNEMQTSYTVFGKVLSGTNVISTIAALPTDNLGTGLPTVPVANLTQDQINAGATVGAGNLIFTNGITVQVGTSYTVSSDNKALVIPAITNGVLAFTYGAGLSGTANVTVTATNLDGTTASTSVLVTVPDAATPTVGPVAAPFTAPYTVTGTTGGFSVLGPDTDSVSALNPASVTIVTQPTNGTATADATTGLISYTPNAGYTGTDTLSYTIADEAGTVSAPAVVTLYAAPTPVKVTVKAGRLLVFTEPDGVVGHLSVGGGQAVVTFTNYQVTTKTRGAAIFATGAGADITDITVTNSLLFSTLTLTANGPVSIGTISDANAIGRIYAPTTTLTGNSSIGSVGYLTVAALNNASLTLGNLPYGSYSFLTIPNVTNSDVTASGYLGLIKSKKWLITDGAKHSITAPALRDLEVPGTFDENLNLSFQYSLGTARVGTPTGTWSLAGQLQNAMLGTPGANWSLSVQSAIQFLTFTKNFNNQVTASSISSLTVKGLTDSAVVQTNGTFGRFLLIGKLNFVGAVTRSVVFSTGSIGTITAPSFTSSRIYAGVALTVAQAGGLAASATDITNPAFIVAVNLGRAAKAFSNSLISADLIGALHLGRVVTANSGNPEGVSTHSIGSITATLVPGGALRAVAANLTTTTALAAYEKKAKLTLGDFVINLL